MTEAKPEGLDGEHVVEFLPGEHFHGFAYPERSALRIWIPREAAYPIALSRPRRRQPGPQPEGLSPIRMHSLEEALVFIVAHELRHLWQAQHGELIAPGIRYLDERDVNAYAAWALRRWRARSFYLSVHREDGCRVPS